VVTSHIVAVAPEPEALPLALGVLLLPELLHAATMVAIAAAAATARAARLLCIVFSSPQGVAADSRSESLGRLSMVPSS
jgi:hypothetical protein